MEKRYVDLNELESKFIKYDIAYTDILDHLTTTSASDIVKKMPLIDLKVGINDRADVVTSRIWSRDDVCAVLRCAKTIDSRTSQMHPFIDKVAKRVHEAFQSLDDDWAKIAAIVEQCILEERDDA